MSGHKQKTPVDLAWLENREQITLQGRQILRRVLDQALTELDHEFQEALHRGEVLEIQASKDELKRLLLKTAQRELSSGK